MRALFKILIIILFPFIFIANYSGAQNIISIESVEFPEIYRNLDMETSVIIDCRDRVRYKKDHVVGAVNVDAFKKNVDEKLYPYMVKETIVLYCNFNTSSQTVMKKLKEAGYNGDIIMIKDGFSGLESNSGELLLSGKASGSK